MNNNDELMEEEEEMEDLPRENFLEETTANL
jgi:hypothetical protein